jgi:hypothetical protein
MKDNSCTPPYYAGHCKPSDLEDSMKRLSPRLYPLRAALAEHFELFMTVVGVLMAILLTVSEMSRGELGMAMIFVIWLQGLILWAVHRHSKLRTQALVHRMRLMMQDRVNNRLTVWLNLSDVQARVAADSGRVEREAVSLAAARAVSLELDKLSFESLRNWERRHARFLSSLL